MFELYHFIIILIISHILADFVFQSDVMAKGKNRHHKTQPPVGQKYMPTWYFWMSAHAITHGGILYILTGIWWVFILESILHFTIDFIKCEKWLTPKHDQVLHWACKISYIILFIII
jgi:hypothetical protein